MNMGSKKEADAFVRIKSQKHPAIVVESGWSEPERDLLEDARLWLLGTNPPVGRVILAYHVETKLFHDERPVDEKMRPILLEADTEELLRDGTPLCKELGGKDTAETRRFKKH